MSIAAVLIELDIESATTRRVLERVPSDKGPWKPHEKSFPMGHLAQLVARLPSWVGVVVDGTEFDIAPKDKPPGSGYTFEKVAALLEQFDRNVASSRSLLARVSDEDLQVPWTLKAGGNPVTTMSRYMVLRTMVINHLVHHRAQLGVYLRLVDVPVPQMYGPTADDKAPGGSTS